jgi:hypothetical protein
MEGPQKGREFEALVGGFRAVLKGSKQGNGKPQSKAARNATDPNTGSDLLTSGDIFNSIQLLRVSSSLL